MPAPKVGEIRRENIFNARDVVYLSIAMRNYAEGVSADGQLDLTWQSDERKASAFVYTFFALDGRVNSIFEYRRYGKVPLTELLKWISMPLPARLHDLLGREISGVRDRLLREVCGFRHSFAHPLTEVTERVTRTSQVFHEDANSWSGAADLIRNETTVRRAVLPRIPQSLRTGYKETLLPAHPFDMERRDLDVALLVLLLYCILLDRKYHSTLDPWPFYGVFALEPDKPHRVVTTAQWYQQILEGCRGPRFRVFHRLKIPSDLLQAR